MLRNQGFIGKLSAVVIFILIAGCVSSLIPKKTKGMSYKKIESDGETIHIATIDPQIMRLQLVRAPKPHKLMAPSEFAQSKDIRLAVNASFFTAEGLPVGATKIKNNWIGFPSKSRGVFGWNEKGQLFFDRLSGDGRNLSKITSDLLKATWWERAENIVGGAPLMIFNGQIIDVAPEQTQASFLESKYARTAICVDKSNQIKIVVVDGGDRNTAKFGLVGGMTIAELAAFLLTENCVHALNLDGGYSSSFVYDGERKNKFKVSALKERAVSTVLLVQVP